MKKNFFYSLTIYITIILYSWGQDTNCGTITPESYKEHYLRVLNKVKQASHSKNTLQKVTILVQNHVTRTTDGANPAVSKEYVNKTIKLLNKGFKSMNIEFISVTPINYIDNSKLHRGVFTLHREQEILSEYKVSNMLNIYHLGKSSSYYGYAGYSFFPKQGDMIVLNAYYAYSNLKELTVTHEAGHYFGLHHTFENEGKESPRRDKDRNCDTTGDMLCDTPADLQYIDSYTTGCKYTGKVKHEDGSLYKPDIFNYMSYSSCVSSEKAHFSDLQRKIIIENLFTHRTDLVFPQLNDKDTEDFTKKTLETNKNFEIGDGSKSMWSREFPHFGPKLYYNDSNINPAAGIMCFVPKEDYRIPLGKPIITFAPINLMNTKKDSAKFSFDYFMKGLGRFPNYAYIDVKISKDNGTTYESIWKEYGATTEAKWYKKTIDLNDYIGNVVFLQIETLYADSGKGIALDNFTLSTKPTNVNEQLYDCITKLPANPYYKLKQETNKDDIDWIENEGPTPSNGTGPSKAYDGKKYWYIEASRNANKEAILNLPCLDLTEYEKPVLSFNYHMYGEDMGSLYVQVSYDGGLTYKNRYIISGNKGNQWKSLKLYLERNSYYGSLRVRFKGVVGKNFKSDIALDNIRLSAIGYDDCITTLPVKPYYKLKQETDTDDIDWIENEGPTPSSGTGPSKAYDGKKYWYIEASRNANKEAILNVRCVDLTKYTDPYLKFNYHMYGSNMGKLKVEISYDGGKTYDPRYTLKGDKGNEWKKLKIFLKKDKEKGVNGVIHIRFKGIVGDGYQSDIALDNILISSPEVDNTKNKMDNNNDNENITSLTNHHNNVLSIYPNPVVAGNGFYIDIPEVELLDLKNSQVQLFDVLGREVKTMNLKPRNEIYDVKNLNPGMYFIKVHLGKKVYEKKIMIKHQ